MINLISNVFVLDLFIFLKHFFNELRYKLYGWVNIGKKYDEAQVKMREKK